MDLAVKFLLLFSLLIIFFQDIKLRKVYWFLFPLVGVCVGYLHYSNTLPELFLAYSASNLLFVSILLLIVLVYSKLKLKTQFKKVFGFGDILMFIALSFSFAMVSFVYIFICSLIFSLITHLFVKNKKKADSVPLAGYMSIFFFLVFTGYWLGLINSVYSI